MEINLRRRILAISAVSAVLLGVVIFLTMLSEQRKSQTEYTKDLFAMDTFFTLRAYGPAAEGALENCVRRVWELEDRLSVTEEGSDIWYINQGAFSDSMDADVKIGADTGIAEDTFLLIKAARELGEETDGALDITLYPVLREWGFTTGNYKVPDEEVLRELLQGVDYTKIHLDEERRTVLVPAGMELDLGAVAKGYTGDCLMEILKERGVTSAMLDLGGNIQVLGAKPDGTPWKIAVKDPFDNSKVIGVLEVTDKAVITSGSYERYFVGEDGKNYWHILDPADGYPADSGLVSVTIVGESGMRCDGLSTALFVMGAERAVEFWRQQSEFEMLLVTEDGRVLFTEGLEDFFECGEGWNSAKIPKSSGG